MSRSGLQPDPAWRPIQVPETWQPTLVVVVDTEEEFDWGAPFDTHARRTTNILYQSLAQEIMNRHGVIPTYVIDYPVANTPEAVSALRTIADQGRCEIGAHLHPWVSPPVEEHVNAYNSFPGNLPAALEREKLARLADQIETSFGSRPIIYKAGRYGLGPATFQILRELGFRTDTSVVPHTDFSASGGPNFAAFSARPFWANAGLIELPLSVHFTGTLGKLGPTLYPALTRTPGSLRLPGIAARVGLLERLRLSPEGHSLQDMKRQTRAALARGERYFMLTYHSSTLLPGGSPYVGTLEMREAFLQTLDGYLEFFMGECRGRASSVSDVAAAMGQLDA